MDHTPVLLQEVLTALQPTSPGKYIDATVGDGGHAQAILVHSQPKSKLLGLDQDDRQIKIAQVRLQEFGQRALLVPSRFSELGTVARQHGFDAVDGILFDLGISSRQLSDPHYGLSFDDDAPLDMRLSPEAAYTVADFLNRANEVEIADILYLYGDRHNSRSLARKLVQYRRKHSFQSARDVKEALQLWHPGVLAPLFQALRIWVNQEFEQLEAALPQALELLKPGGTLAVISFHSGEDKRVKRFFASHKDRLTIHSIVKPTFTEIKANSRARSAILRAVTKK